MNELIELFLVFFKLGAFTIGGGIAMLPLLKDSMINDKKWFTNEEFVDIVAVCQSLPGVIAVNMATYVGYKKKRLIGSVIATLGVVLPSFVLIIIIAEFISNMSDNPYVNGAMAGFRAAALGLVAVAVIQLSSAVFKSLRTVIAAVLAFVMIEILNINTAYVILIFVALGISSVLVGSRRKIADIDKAEDREGRGSQIRSDEEDRMPVSSDTTGKRHRPEDRDDGKTDGVNIASDTNKEGPNPAVDDDIKEGPNPAVDDDIKDGQNPAVDDDIKERRILAAGDSEEGGDGK